MKNTKVLNLGLYRIFRKMGVERDEMQLESTINWDLLFDNYDMNIFLFLLESKFNIEVQENEINKLTTIEHTLKFIENKLAIA